MATCTILYWRPTVHFLRESLLSILQGEQNIFPRMSVHTLAALRHSPFFVKYFDTFFALRFLVYLVLSLIEFLSRGPSRPSNWGLILTMHGKVIRVLPPGLGPRGLHSLLLSLSLHHCIPLFAILVEPRSNSAAFWVHQSRSCSHQLQEQLSGLAQCCVSVLSPSVVSLL